MNNIKLAIVGATGLVGQTIIKVLEEKKLSINEYAFFASSKSAGKKLNLLGNTYIVKELTYSSFDSNFNFAIFSAGGNVSKEFAPIAVSKGCTVIDNSSYFRMDPNVPLVVPEVNFSDANKNTGIIANPNCSTIQAVVALKPLDDKYKIKRIVYNTYQAVSGAGYKGVNDLKNGIENFDKELSIFENQKTSYELQKFNVSIFNNCIPHIDMLLDNGYSKEEEKMINETRKILNNPNLKMHIYPMKKFKGIQDEIYLLGISPFNDDHLWNAIINNRSITKIVYYYHSDKARKEMEEHFSDTRITYLPDTVFWGA